MSLWAVKSEEIIDWEIVLASNSFFLMGMAVVELELSSGVGVVSLFICLFFQF